MWWWQVLACVDEHPLGGQPDFEPVALDDASRLGFSADEVLALLGPGERAYDVTGIDEGSDERRNADSALLLASGPFLVGALMDPEAFVFTSLFGSEVLRIEGTVTIRSADGQFDTGGRLALDAQALAEEALSWNASDVLSAPADSTFPAWVWDAEAVSGVRCPGDEDTEGVALVLVPDGALASPTLGLEAHDRDRTDDACQNIDGSSLASVFMVAAEEESPPAR